MSDYFDQFERALMDAVARRAHLRWYARVRLPIRGHGLGIAIAALVVAAPAVAAVGAASGWFSAGKPDLFYPASSTSGLGKSIPGTRMLPIRVADPDGGPPWGMRLVRTSRGDTCVQVGRVEYGEIGSLGIDYSWGNDHKFHPINPSDGVADVCGATDAAGHGFVSSSRHGWPASAFTPSDYGSGTAFSYCQAATPGAELRTRLSQLPKGSKARSALETILKRQEAAAAQSQIHACPSGSLRMIFVGLLGPDAKSVTYKTPSGATESEDTVGGVGAYLIVFKQTVSNCNDFSTTLMGGGVGCGDNYGSTGGSSLRGPNAVTSVTYNNGKTCTDEPSPSVVAAYRTLIAQFRRHRDETAKQARARMDEFLAAHHLTERGWLQAIRPQCQPVGWIARKQHPLTPAGVASPLEVSVSEGRRVCSKGPWSENSVDDSTIVCDHRIPKGYTSYYESKAGTNGPLFALIRVSFIARQPVTTTNSYFEWNIQNPNGGGGGNRTQADIRRGQQVIFTMSEAIPGTGAPTNETVRGVYRGTISYMQNAGQNGANGGDMPDHDGSIVVGRFSFKLPPPPTHRSSTHRS